MPQLWGQCGCLHLAGLNPMLQLQGHEVAACFGTLLVAERAAQLEISRYQHPWRNMLLSQKEEHNYIWKRFIFSSSFIILLVYVTVTHALFLLTRPCACRGNNMFACLMHSLSVWGLVVSERSGSSKGFFSDKHFHAVRVCRSVFFFFL